MQPSVTLLVVPREQFSKTARSLESIYAHTSAPVSLVYVDGNSPPPIRRYLERQSQHLGFLLLREERYLAANEARMIGLPYCTGEYVVFLDNDVEVTPGWLEPLLQCAQETGAPVVGPMYYLGDPRDRIIHTAGAEMAIVERNGTRSLHEKHRLGNRPASEARDLGREPIDLVEFHCMLARRDAVDEAGIDAGLLSFLDHNDFCLAVKNAGYDIYIEPKSIVSHLTPPPIAVSDLPYFVRRWSNAWIDASVEHFARKHRLPIDDDGLRSHYRFRDSHRLRLIARFRKALERTLGWRAVALLDRFVNRVVCDRVIEHFLRPVLPPSGDQERERDKPEYARPKEHFQRER